MKRSMTLIAVLASVPAFAQEATTQGPLLSFQNVMVAIITTLLFAVLLLVLVLYKVVNMMKHETSGIPYPHQQESNETIPFWDKLLSLKPLSAEKDLELDHSFDGIKELNNPIPGWFNVLFYGSILSAFIYIIAYHVADLAPLQAKEYENELAEAKIARQEYIKNAGNLVDENNVTILADVSGGRELFTTKCAVCHGDKGEGKVGPNLTDVYWLHGGDVKSIFKTIKYGVPSKGMVAWQNSMNGGQIQQLASFILTLQGTNPPGAKEPQGEKFAAGDSLPVK